MTLTWEKLEEEYIKVGFIQIIRKTFRLPDGKVASFEIRNEGQTITVLALTPDHHVVLTKQFRPGIESILLELPGGLVELGLFTKSCG